MRNPVTGKDDPIDGCPLDAVTPDVWRLLHIVAMKPVLPVGGGYLDQTQVFISAYEFALSEQADMKAELGI